MTPPNSAKRDEPEAWKMLIHKLARERLAISTALDVLKDMEEAVRGLADDSQQYLSLIATIRYLSTITHRLEGEIMDLQKHLADSKAYDPFARNSYVERHGLEPHKDNMRLEHLELFLKERAQP